jgi:hypothetical protein
VIEPYHLDKLCNFPCCIYHRIVYEFLSSILYYLPTPRELTDNFNFQILFREDATVDDFIDVIEGNRKYMKCVYVYNKIDVVGIDDVDRLSRQPNSVVISCNLKVAASFTD